MLPMEQRRGVRPARASCASGRALVYVFLFAPIVVVVLFSFNSIKSLPDFDGFSLQWYSEFFNDPSLRESLFASLEIAPGRRWSSATVIGTALAFGLVALADALGAGREHPDAGPAGDAGDRRRGLGAAALHPARASQLSLWTIMLAHITFSISYVTVVVRGRLAAISHEVEEAAMDLGATRWQSVRLVAAAGAVAGDPRRRRCSRSRSRSTTSCSRSSPPARTPQPLPVRIWSAIRFGVSPTINAIGTLMMVDLAVRDRAGRAAAAAVRAPGERAQRC